MLLFFLLQFLTQFNRNRVCTCCTLVTINVNWFWKYFVTAIILHIYHVYEYALSIDISVLSAKQKIRRIIIWIRGNTNLSSVMFKRNWNSKTVIYNVFLFHHYKNKEIARVKHLKKFQTRYTTTFCLFLNGCT